MRERSSRETFSLVICPKVGWCAIAMGSATYEWTLEHDDLLEHPEKWHGYYDDTPCWVFSHRELSPIPGVDLRFVRGEVGQVHRAMLEAAGSKNIWLVGGGDLVGQFSDEGLLDEIQLSIAPVTQARRCCLDVCSPPT